LWDRAGADVPTPPPIDCDPAGETRWEGFVDGDGFSSRAAAVGPQVAAAEAMAALVALHAVPLEGLPRQDSGTVLARTAGTALRRIEKAGLAAAEDCRRVCATLGTDPPPLDARDAVTLHGDFHTGNTIHGEGRATLIDMDDLASGDAAFDVAMFASRILLVQMVAGDDGSAAAAAAAGIGRSYEAAGGAPIDPARLAWFVAALLIGRQVKTCVTHAAPDLDALARRLAGLAAAVARARRLDAETLEPWLDGR
jgi:aminoglycoside phosphotransferase (APT) family kinase protein